jgi:hypothetical protein
VGRHALRARLASPPPIVNAGLAITAPQHLDWNMVQGNRGLPSTPSGGSTTPLSVAFALALVVAAAQPVAAATITINAERRGDTCDIRASVALNADAATAWRVLTDYDHYTEFIPDLHVSRVVARGRATVTVEQSGDAALWLLRMPLAITFEITEFPPNSLQSRAVAGSLRALTSSYTLTPATSGVRLDYAGRVTPGFELFGPLEQMAVQQSVARQFQALADEIARRSAANRGHTIAEPY